jgi:hypothetical protein
VVLLAESKKPLLLSLLWAIQILLLSSSFGIVQARKAILNSEALSQNKD